MTTTEQARRPEMAKQPADAAERREAWYAGRDGEHYNDGPYESVEAAMEGVVHGYDLQPGDTFWVGRAGVLDLTMSVADELIDQVIGQIQDEVGGDYADDTFRGITKEMEQDLDDAINREFQAWMDRHGVRPTCFPIIDEQEHTVPAEVSNA